VARRLSAGHDGQVLVSGVATDLAQGGLPPQSAMRELGSHRLTDLAYPEQVYQLVAPDLPAEFPPLRTLDVLPNNLPLQLTTFLGREEEVTGIRALLERSRLVTLVGSGGVGKTRASLQVAAELLERFPDGAWLLELAPLKDAAVIAYDRCEGFRGCIYSAAPRIPSQISVKLDVPGVEGEHVRCRKPRAYPTRVGTGIKRTGVARARVGGTSIGRTRV